MSVPGPRASEHRELVMHLWVPAEGGLRSLAGELAARIAEYLGIDGSEARTVSERVERVAAALGHGGPADRAIAFEFRHAERELVIAGRCAGETSEVRHPLPE